MATPAVQEVAGLGLLRPNSASQSEPIQGELEPRVAGESPVMSCPAQGRCCAHLEQPVPAAGSLPGQLDVAQQPAGGRREMHRGHFLPGTPPSPCQLRSSSDPHFLLPSSSAPALHPCISKQSGHPPATQQCCTWLHPQCLLPGLTTAQAPGHIFYSPRQPGCLGFVKPCPIQ